MNAYKLLAVVISVIAFGWGVALSRVDILVTGLGFALLFIASFVPASLGVISNENVTKVATFFSGIIAGATRADLKETGDFLENLIRQSQAPPNAILVMVAFAALLGIIFGVLAGRTEKPNVLGQKYERLEPRVSSELIWAALKRLIAF